MRRFHCRHCGKTFNALPGTPLAHLHYKGRSFAFAQSLSEGETVRRSAARCDVAVSTAWRGRHGFLRAIKTDTARLGGIVEADETYVLESHKGSRVWKRAEQGQSGAVAAERKPRKRGRKLATGLNGSPQARFVTRPSGFSEPLHPPLPLDPDSRDLLDQNLDPVEAAYPRALVSSSVSTINLPQPCWQGFAWRYRG